MSNKQIPFEAIYTTLTGQYEAWDIREAIKAVVKDYGNQAISAGELVTRVSDRCLVKRRMQEAEEMRKKQEAIVKPPDFRERLQQFIARRIEETNPPNAFLMKAYKRTHRDAWGYYPESNRYQSAIKEGCNE